MSRQYNNILKHLQEHFDINTTLDEYSKMYEKNREFSFTCKLKKHVNTLKHTSYVNKRSLFTKENKPLQEFCVYCVDEKDKENDIENYKEQILEKTGHLLLSYDTKSRDSEYICGNCNVYSKTHITNLLHHNLGNCSKCQHEKFRLSYDKLKSDVENHGFKLLTKPEEYVSNKQKLDVICKCGKEYKTYLVSIRQDKHCIDCKTEKCENTCMEKYNERNVMHVNDIFYKCQEKFSTTKEYKFEETGRKITIQGTEDIVIKYILNNENKLLKRKIVEDDIIQNNIPNFKYIFEDKELKYYPDFHIKNTNLIIEAKTIDTHNRQNPLKNYNKFKSVNNNNYNIMVIILNNKKELYDIWYFLVNGKELSVLNENNNNINFKEKLSNKIKVNNINELCNSFNIEKYIN